MPNPNNFFSTPTTPNAGISDVAIKYAREAGVSAELIEKSGGLFQLLAVIRQVQEGKEIDLTAANGVKSANDLFAFRCSLNSQFRDEANKRISSHPICSNSAKETSQPIFSISNQAVSAPPRSAP